MPGWWWLCRCCAAVCGFADIARCVKGTPGLVCMFIQVRICVNGNSSNYVEHIGGVTVGRRICPGHVQ